MAQRDTVAPLKALAKRRGAKCCEGKADHCPAEA